MVRKKDQVQNTDIFTQIRFAESYTSLIVGAVVVIVASILVTSGLKSFNIIKQLSQRGEISSQKTENTSMTKSKDTQFTTYVVAEGDTLKSISLRFYNTEDYWEKIAKENNIVNPDIIEIGTQLKISGVGSKQVAGETSVQVDASNKITGNSYTVKADEYLWDIAVRAYGDGFRWVDIAQANNLVTPDSISTGMVLKIPR